jgi:quercetin dioxygenase-like cupin family protein
MKLSAFREELMVKKLVVVLVAICACVSTSYSQQPGPIKRTLVQKAEFPGDKMATLLVMIEVVPNGVVARHTHPGVEVGYVINGSVEFTISDEAPKTYRRGDTYMIPVTTPYSAVAGPAGVRLVGTFVVDKDKPLASPAP